MSFPITPLIAACTLFSVLSAQPADAQQAADKTDCILSGHVMDAASGEPLRKSNVSLSRQGSSPYQPRRKDTDAAGRFEFRNVEPGRYTLSVERTGFINQSYGASRPGRPGGSIITLVPGQELKGLDIKLMRYGVALGRVVDEEGDPIAGAYLAASRMDARGVLTTFAFATTNDVGEYRMSGIRPGTYLMVATLRRDLSESAPEPDSDAKEMDFMATYYPSNTDPATARQFQVKSGDETRGIDIQMVRTRVVRVRGVVLNGATGKPSQAVVTLRPKQPGFGGISGTRRTSTMEPGGTFELRGVLPGQYWLAAYSNSPEGSISSMRNLLVGGDNIRDVVMTLTAGATLHGTLNVEGDTDSADSGSTVVVVLSSADGDTSRSGDRQTEVKPDGSFTLKDVQPGQYFVSVGEVKRGYLKSARIGDQDVLDDGLEIQEGAVAGTMRLVISSRCAEVSGILQDEEGKGRPGATAVLLPEEQFRDQRDHYGIGTTDQYGAFHIENVRPGKYKLIALEDTDGPEWMDPEFTKPYEKNAVALVLEEGQKESRDLTIRSDKPVGN